MTLIENAFIVNEGRVETGDVLIENGLIARVGVNLRDLPEVAGAEVVNGSGQWLFPGCIDDQVHFREPGL